MKKNKKTKELVSSLLHQWIVYQPDYSYQQYEQAFWHLFNLNNYHVTLSFDVNMCILLTWALNFHLDRK